MRRKGGKVLTALAAAAFGFVVGISFPVVITPKLQYGGMMPWSSSSGAANSSFLDMSILGRLWPPSSPNLTNSAFAEVATARNPEEGAERRLPPGIVVSETDLHLRRLWGSPTQDSATRKYLLALAVGYDEKANVDATIQKFSDNFDIVLFHYDGRTTEWDEVFEWSKEVAHVSARKQTKWWFAKRFLHPSIVAPYDYIFLWDEDLGVENFTAEAYLDIVRKHGLEISQPGLDATNGTTNYDITIKRNDSEIHKTDAARESCRDVHKPPCSGFVEVMAPVFSRDAWRCVWHMIQNDFVHAWGLDSNFWRCVHDPEEQIGIVDAQYLVHHAVPTLQGQGEKEKEGGRSEVRARQFEEMRAFRSRVSDADDELANRTSSIQN
ncbi:hypothetical protein CFC21_111896 [Triticum aestivum]|uniref:Glycosyltransferase family 92 protein n=2 Tax=Triticum aestivum TaxID=4565 RepID=A0A9R1NFH4_WHEAT|nr:uncharacterized protein LOC123166563 [Triticum aestivum]KAF7111931.1 hypothetical protein CFC21_111886 [Triticum aestivum]KAF7111942.1 hypothetical protein CFC21_111896 [Triticum aestivum]